MDWRHLKQQEFKARLCGLRAARERVDLAIASQLVLCETGDVLTPGGYHRAGVNFGA